MTRCALGCLMAFLAATPLGAQSTIRNARLQEQAAGDLPRTFHQLASAAGPLWIAYAVPAQSPDWSACCWDNHPQSGCGRCSIEERSESNITIGTSGKKTVTLEGGTSVIVMFRAEGGRVGTIRSFAESCEIDAGGRAVHWLTGVDPAASVLLLKTLVQSGPATSDEDRPRRLVGQGLAAIAAHNAPESVTTLIDLARNDREAKVRSEALFWLAQRAGHKAAGAITDAIANDPDTKVKERAVFALSQLPNDDGVPKLIDVARTNRNPRVRQQAVFWLGQSKDPRALKFFEEILLK
jgi:hypothetical protein